MLHAEALLLVDDDQSQIVRVHIAREQPVRAHKHLHVAFGEALQRCFLLLGRAEAREHFHGDAEGAEAVLEGGVVLLGQNGGRTEHHHLLAVLGALKAARRATSVLPKPTSPQMRRSIGRGDSMSCFTSAMAAS